VSGLPEQALAIHGLAVVGALHPNSGDGAPAGVATLLLVGAAGNTMWRVFRDSPEHGDGAPDPLDRWSRRVLEMVAVEVGAQALFPFDGPPWLPFQRWAARGEGAHPSPVGMQVSARRGLWVSYRGALGFGTQLEIGAQETRIPCTGCPAPCKTACPVDAFATGVYDVGRCVAHIRTPAGADCLSQGCRVRHACPAGRGTTPPQAQCEFHMQAFLQARRAATGDIQ